MPNVVSECEAHELPGESLQPAVGTVDSGVDIELAVVVVVRAVTSFGVLG